MLLENVRDDESVTPDERNNIFSVLGINHNGHIEDLLSTRQPQQARETENTVSQSARRRNTPNRSR